MNVIGQVESAAESVISVSETIVEAAEVIDEVARAGRRLVHRIIIGVIVLAVVAGVVKVVRTRSQPEPAEGAAAS